MSHTGHIDDAVLRLAQQCLNELQAVQADVVSPGDTARSILTNRDGAVNLDWLVELTTFIGFMLPKDGRLAHHAYQTAQALSKTRPHPTEGPESAEWGIHAEHSMALARACHAAGDVKRALRNWFPVLAAVLEECDDGRVVHALLAHRCAQRIHSCQVRAAIVLPQRSHRISGVQSAQRLRAQA